MKRKSLLFLLLFALLAPWAANAQETLTVCDGGNTNSNVPIYSLYADYGTRSQFIYPAALLEDMAGGTIQNITFYNGTASINFDQGFTVYMMEVDYTTFASTTLVDWSSMTQVYQGSLTVSNNEMSIELDNPYTYGGDNLMIGIQVTSWGTICPSSSWQGENQTGRTALYNNANGSHAWSTSVNGVTFLPKTTFEYTAGAPSTCPRPKNLAASDVTANSAVLTWEAGGDETEWMVEYKTADATEWTLVSGTVNTPTYTLNGLTATTNYQARVQAACNEGKYVSTTFTTPCDAYNIPYTYDFEAEAPFACWTPIAGVTRGNSSSNAHNSTYYLRFAGTTSNLVALPQFNEATNNLRVEFWTRPESATNSSCGTFSVGYMTDITDASTFIEVASYAYNDWSTATYVKKTVDFVNAPANANIAFRHNAGSTSWYWFADDVTVKEIPSCLAPTALAANATTNSAELSWTANSGETAWTLYWKKTTDENYTEVANATNPYTLSGLDAATNYQYYVVANCSSTDASEPSEVFHFLTECEAISTYPWTENFDSYTGASSGSTNNLPVCWNYINTCSYSTYKGYPVIYSASGYSHSGNNHLRFYSYYSSSYSSYDPQDQYAILPEMENLNGKQLSLFARGANTNSSFKVGLMTDPTDVSTFVEIATTTPTTGYVEYTYNLTGTGNYIAIMMEAANSTATSRTVYIDDISIAEPPACPKPTDLTVVPNSVTPHSVQLSWVSDATAWIVAYKTADDADFTEVNATENPFTLTGLTDGKTYTAKVCAVCDGTPGEWTSNTVSFSTPIACPAPTNLACSGTTGSQTTLNWSGTSDSYDVLYRTAAYADGIYENFGTRIPSGWEMYTGLLTNGTATLTPATYGWSFGTGNGVFDNHARVNIYDNYQRWLVTKAFTVLQDASTLSFDIALTAFSGTDVPAPATTGTDDKFIVLISTNNMSSWIPLREWNNSGSEYVYNNIANTATGENVSLDLSAYVGQSVRIAFYGESTTSNADNNLHIDNVHCGIPHEAGEWQTAAEGVTDNTYTLTGLNPETDYEAKVLSNCEGETGHETIISFTTEAACMVPSELEVVSVTTTTAVLTWTSSSTAWQIQVNEEEPVEVTSIPYTLEGLTPATTYTFKVRANCDGSYTDWSNAASFTTDCDAITTFPWSEDFESYSASSSGVKFEAPCWVNEHISGSGSYFFEVYSGTNGTNSTKQLRLRDMYSGTMTKLMLPEMTLPSNDYLFSIDVFRNISTANYGEGIRVFVSTDGEIEGATELAFISRSYATSDGNLIPAESASGWYTYELPIGISGTCYIILRGESLYGSSTYMDNFAVKQMPTCLKPTAFECTATTTTTATFSWINGAADQTAWQICLNDDETNLIMADSNPFTVENLTAATAYTAKVRAYCSEEDQSDWSNEVSFATDCDAITTFPWMVDFESFAEGTVPTCWDNSASTTSTLSGNPERVWGVYLYGENKMIRMYNYFVQNGTALINTPDLVLPTDAEYTLTFDYSHTATCGDFIVKVSEDGGTTFTDLATYSKGSGTSYTDPGEFTPATISLAAYAGKTITLQFFANANYGSGAIFVDNVTVSASAPSTVTQTIELTAGWNWFSAYVEGDAVELLQAIENGLGDKGITIKASEISTDYYEDFGWFGELDALGIVNEQMYLINVTESCTVELQGTPANPANHTITINPGWNWIGFPCAEAVSVAAALAGFEAEEGDVLKGSELSTDYYGEEFGWFGGLETLEPGQGYLYKYNGTTPQTLTFRVSARKADDKK